MSRVGIQNSLMKRRVRACGSSSFVFCTLHASLVVGYIWISIKLLRTKAHKHYSAYEDRDRFLDAVGKFSNLRVSRRAIARQDFLNTQHLHGSERDLLRFFITDYLKFHRENEANGTRRLIYRPREVGNGDRFNCMLFSYWAAVLTKRVFVLDWDEPFPISLFLKSASGAKIFLAPEDSGSTREQCNPPACIVLNEHDLNGNRYESVLSSKTNIVFIHSHKVPLRVADSFLNQHKPKNISTWMIESFLSSETFRRSALHHVLRLSDSMAEDHKVMSKGLRLTSGSFSGKRARSLRWAKGLDNVLNRNARHYIGVHARLGLGVGEFPTQRFREVATRMKEIAKCLASRAVRLSVLSGSPPVPIFLATDTAEFRDVFHTAVKRINGEGTDVLFGNWSTVHVAKIRHADMNASGRGYGKPWESVWGGFMDLVLLGHAEHIVALYSGFPRLALALGDAETLVELRNEICLEEQWG